MELWGMALGKIPLEQEEYLASLPKDLPGVEWLWGEMDRVWEKQGLDNRQSLSSQAIGDYYSHPVWVVNGVFTCQDSVSQGHRLAIATFLEKTEVTTIADYGGGFAQLALSLSNTSSDFTIDIIEPYPSEVGLSRVVDCKKISFKSDFNNDQYDCVIAQDVLEHVESPVDLAYRFAENVKEEGLLIFANCFYPVIQCHLPSTFHLRYNFKGVMKAMGLEFVGVVPGAEHALVFRRKKSISLDKAKREEKISRMTGGFKNFIYPSLGKIKRFFRIK